MTEHTKELSIVETNKVAALMPNLFGDINVDSLDKQIDILGKSGRDMQPEEKQSALSLIHEWEGDVINRIRTHINDMKEFTKFLTECQFTNYQHENPACPGVITTKQSEALAAETKTVKQYTAMKEAYDKWFNIFTGDDRPDEDNYDVDDPDITRNESLERGMKFKADTQAFHIKLSRLEREVYKTERTWKKDLNRDAETAELVQRVQKYSKEIGKIHDQCQIKGRLARTAIAINNEEVRKALHEMDDFISTIGRI